MFRAQDPSDNQDEAKMQDLMFKLNIVLFIGTIVAIRTGNFLNQNLNDVL